MTNTYHHGSVFFCSDVGYYLHREDPNLGKHRVPHLLLPSILDLAALRRHRERGGESPPPSSSSLASPLDGRRVPPLVLGLHGGGGEGAPPRLDLPLCSLMFLFSRCGQKPFLIFREIRNSDCAEILTRFFSGYKLPCTRSRDPTDVRGGHNPPPCARGLWRALVSCGLCGPPFAVIPTLKNHIYSKIILRKKFIAFGLRLISIFCETKNMQQTGTSTGHWINRLVQ